MKEGKPSRTADAVAALRTAESMKPENQRICYDPLVKDFLSTKYRLLSRSRLLTRIGLWNAEREAPGVFGYNVARCRYIDDYLRSCIVKGIEQLVILGAGYDTRAYRFDELRGKVSVFEVDHPDTQRVKKEKVRKIFGSLPTHVVYVPVDFNKEKLADKLFENGYDRSLKTLFIWEGTTMYIEAEAVDETLAFVRDNSGDGSSVIFDYVYKALLDESPEFPEARKINRAHKRRGEPTRFGIEKGSIEEFLSTRGFCNIRNLDCDFFRAAHFHGVNANRTIYRLFALVHADVRHDTTKL